MVRTIEVPGDQIEVRDGQVEVHADIGAARVLRATLHVEEIAPSSIAQPSQVSVEEWDKELDELLKYMPKNAFPVDDSREAIYGPDPDEIAGNE